ncbi:hypothetical protein [Butyrivibrio sp. NC3005]|uniref:hypothetical protein n=1 Tax=Butyrivibrio sp. NC3005 TaxID=1280685 RepID=UPI000401D9E7|nr:hypothetical protein [Butyrivibrio sp. NC3005]
MDKARKVTRDITMSELIRLIDTGHIYDLPLIVGRDAYIVVKGQPSQVMVTDVAVKTVQLSGQWYTWEELEKLGGVYATEFEALASIHDKKKN